MYAKGAHHSLQVLASLGYDVVSVDWCIDPTIARDFIDCTIQGKETEGYFHSNPHFMLGKNTNLEIYVNSDQYYLGNLDPCALYAKPEDLSKLTVDMLEKFGVRRFIANLGMLYINNLFFFNCTVSISLFKKTFWRDLKILQFVGLNWSFNPHKMPWHITLSQAMECTQTQIQNM